MFPSMSLPELTPDPDNIFQDPLYSLSSPPGQPPIEIASAVQQLQIPEAAAVHMASMSAQIEGLKREIAQIKENQKKSKSPNFTLGVNLNNLTPNQKATRKELQVGFFSSELVSC